jgi:hypothetical protein
MPTSELALTFSASETAKVKLEDGSTTSRRDARWLAVA